MNSLCVLCNAVEWGGKPFASTLMILTNRIVWLESKNG
jgi:hypothetical protein